MDLAGPHAPRAVAARFLYNAKAPSASSGLFCVHQNEKIPSMIVLQPREYICNRNLIRMLRIFLISFVLLFNPAAAQDRSPNLLQKFYGKTPASSVMYNPWRSHYWPYQDFGYTHMYGASYKSVTYMSFINTYRERCHLVAFRRNWVSTNRFDLAYGIGINYGYDGRLYFARSIPVWIRETILFKTDFNPMAGFDLSYRLAKGLHANLVFSPIFVTWGASYQFNYK